jgi:hypothetical protein
LEHFPFSQVKKNQPFGYQSELVEIGRHVTSLFIGVHNSIANVSQMLKDNPNESTITVAR